MRGPISGFLLPAMHLIRDRICSLHRPPKRPKLPQNQNLPRQRQRQPMSLQIFRSLSNKHLRRQPPR